MHSWGKIGHNRAKCKNADCPWYREVENFDGQYISVYVHPNGKKQRHAPPCGVPPAPKNDEIYSVKDVEGEQLNFAHLLKMESILLTAQMLKSRRNSFGKML